MTKSYINRKIELFYSWQKSAWLYKPWGFCWHSHAIAYAVFLILCVNLAGTEFHDERNRRIGAYRSIFRVVARSFQDSIIIRPGQSWT